MAAAAVSVLRGSCWQGDGATVDSEKNPWMLLDQLAALDPPQRRKVAARSCGWRVRVRPAMQD